MKLLFIKRFKDKPQTGRKEFKVISDNCYIKEQLKYKIETA